MEVVMWEDQVKGQQALLDIRMAQDNGRTRGRGGAWVGVLGRGAGWGSDHMSGTCGDHCAPAQTGAEVWGSPGQRDHLGHPCLEVCNSGEQAPPREGLQEKRRFPGKPGQGSGEAPGAEAECVGGGAGGGRGAGSQLDTCPGRCPRQWAGLTGTRACEPHSASVCLS